jgi:hypothetical protein
MKRLSRAAARAGRKVLFGEYGLVPIDFWLRFRRIRYQVTATHLDILVDDVAERSLPLDQIVDAAPVGDSFGRPFRFWRFLPPWRYERWGNNPTRSLVVVHRRTGPHLLLTPENSRAFLDELERARLRLEP